MRDVAQLRQVFAAVDEFNRQDPNQFEGTPLALLQGTLASSWLPRLVEAPSVELEIAARAHHLGRWEIKRSSFPEGRAGYLKWRTRNKAHQGERIAPIMSDCGFDAPAIERVQELLLRTKLRTDPEVQALEDAACLVFLDTQYEEMAAKTPEDKLARIVEKTINKMSPKAIELAGLEPQPANAGGQHHDGHAHKS